MKKHNNHFLLISIVSIFLFFLSSTVLVTAVGTPVNCIEVCDSGGGVSEGSYCDVDGPCCCPPLSCIGHICSVG
jgi:hypothetical protein